MAQEDSLNYRVYWEALYPSISYHNHIKIQVKSLSYCGNILMLGDFRHPYCGP